MASELGRLFREFAASAWRLETRDQYLVPEEEQLYADFRAGKPVPRLTPVTNAWIGRLADARGRSFARVHVVSRPLSSYVRFELAMYRDSVAYGEDVRIADRAAHPDGLADLTEDFWIFDGRTVAVMSYDPDGRFLGATVAEDPEPYLRLRERAVASSVPIDAFQD